MEESGLVSVHNLAVRNGISVGKQLRSAAAVFVGTLCSTRLVFQGTYWHGWSCTIHPDKIMLRASA